MGQWEVYQAIRALGGSATARQIHEFLESAGPATAYSGSSSNKKSISVTQLYIKRLCDAGLLSKRPLPGMRCGTWTYSIAAEYPERNTATAAVAVAGTATAATAVAMSCGPGSWRRMKRRDG